MSLVTIYVGTPAGRAAVLLPDDLAVGHLAGPLAARAGVDDQVATRLAHETLGLLDGTATLQTLGLGDGSTLRVVLDPAPPQPAGPAARSPLPVRTVPVGWVGAHGGAGTSTLARLLGGADHQRTPQPGTLATVIVARPTAAGLHAVQAAAHDWPVPGPPLRGLVLIAATPGRLPRPLRELRHLVEGAYPQTWRIPWIEPLHRGDPPPPVRALTRLALDLDLTPPDHPSPQEL